MITFPQLESPFYVALSISAHDFQISQINHQYDCEQATIKIQNNYLHEKRMREYSQHLLTGEDKLKDSPFLKTETHDNTTI